MFHIVECILPHPASRLGFIINWMKTASYPRVFGCCPEPRAVLSESRRMDLLQTVERLCQSAAVTALTVMCVLGLMAIAYPVVPLGLWHMYRLQRCKKVSAWIPRGTSGIWLPFSIWFRMTSISGVPTNTSWWGLRWGK